jgi:hypothetical protein
MNDGLDHYVLHAEFTLSDWTKGSTHDVGEWDHNDEPDDEPYVCSEEARRMVQMADELDLMYEPAPVKKRASYGSYLARKRNQKQLPPKPKKKPAPKRKKKKPPIPSCFAPKKKDPPVVLVAEKPHPLVEKKSRRKNQLSMVKKKRGMRKDPPVVLVAQKPSPVAKKKSRRKNQLSMVMKKHGMPTKNEEGYSMKQCEYEYAESRFVYRPPGYSNGLDQQGHHCTECHLKPCITTKHHEEASEWISTSNILEVHPNDRPLLEAEVAEIMERHRCKALNLRYVADREPPQCILSFAKHSVNFDPDEDSDDDTDSILDDFPYSLLRDRQVGDPPTSVLLDMYHKKLDPPRPGMWKRFNYSFFDKNRHTPSNKEHSKEEALVPNAKDQCFAD